MISVPLAQPKNQLSELIGRVERSETVAVTRRGKPVAQLVMCTADSAVQQREQVQHVFAALRELSNVLALDGDLRALSREGLA